MTTLDSVEEEVDSALRFPSRAICSVCVIFRQCCRWAYLEGFGYSVSSRSHTHTCSFICVFRVLYSVQRLSAGKSFMVLLRGTLSRFSLGRVAGRGNRVVEGRRHSSHAHLPENGRIWVDKQVRLGGGLGPIRVEGHHGIRRSSGQAEPQEQQCRLRHAGLCLRLTSTLFLPTSILPGLASSESTSCTKRKQCTSVSSTWVIFVLEEEQLVTGFSPGIVFAV